MLKARGRKNLTLEDAEAISEQVQSTQRVAPMLTGTSTVRLSGECWIMFNWWVLLGLPIYYGVSN
jgi:hypothetical protein